jgi:hypothetical protein
LRDESVVKVRFACNHDDSICHIEHKGKDHAIQFPAQAMISRREPMLWERAD